MKTKLDIFQEDILVKTFAFSMISSITQKPGLILLTDFEKAFDSVSWDFLFKVIDFFNFGPSFKKWIKVFYTNIESCVIVNGHLSDWFYLQRGCRQGDPLSPYLFILCAEILALLIRNNPNIKGIIAGNTEFCISQYADDTSMILDGSERSLNACITTLKFYAEASGLYMNMDKTQVIWIGSKKIVGKDSVNSIILFGITSCLKH